MSAARYLTATFVALFAAAAIAQEAAPPSTANAKPADALAASATMGNAIFIHPDGAAPNSWMAARALYYGPDGDLHWDRLPHIALYRCHVKDRLTATSNAGGTVHAYGIKVDHDAYGLTSGGEDGKPIVDAKGRSLSVAHQALRAGLPVGLVQTGTITEPGTGCFLASVPSRSMHNEIASQLIASGAHVLLGGGERYFLPEGEDGVYGPGVRTDGRNLIKEAEEAGYTVVRTRDDLLKLPAETDKVLGLFASYHTFNDRSEEELREKNLPTYNPGTPSVAEMTAVALRILDAKGKRFLLVVEEEGTDNFGNNENASGTLEALKRADDAIGIARAYLAQNPHTMILTAADSDAGGMQMIGLTDGQAAKLPRLPPRDPSGAQLDGVTGTGGAPFTAAPDREGRQMKFVITWASDNDVTGGILSRAEGMNAHLVRGSIDNTQITALLRQTLFGNPSGPMEEINEAAE